MKRSAIFVSCLALMSALAVLVPAGAQASTAAGGARDAATGGSWGKAREVPGIAALNEGQNAKLPSVSCASAGNCSAGGYYAGGTNGDSPEAFVATEVKGTWQEAEEVPGTAALNVGGEAEVTSVSCASAGDCSAGGFYTDGSGYLQAFVASEVSGTWQEAEEVPGTAALNVGGEAEVTSVSCASAGDCSAGGYYATGSGGAGDHTQAFVVSEVSGTWQEAGEVPGTAALNTDLGAEVTSVSCASAGNCGAGGYYTAGSEYYTQAFVVSETGGTWRKAEEVPGTATLNSRGGAEITSVSCASAGNCGAGGYYTGGVGQEAMVVSETGGTWRKAEEVPGTASDNNPAGGDAPEVFSVSCASPGNCSAGGEYLTYTIEGFVVNEVKGTWRKAEEVPGTAALNKLAGAVVSSVSCASAGNCSAGGNYLDGEDFYSEAYVVSETHGTWHKAKEVPGIAALNTGIEAGITSVSCASAGHCSAGGTYTTGPAGSGFDTELFVVSET